MKNIILLSFLFLVYSYGYTQVDKRVQPEIGISGMVSAFGWYNGSKVHDFSPSEGNSKNYKSYNGYLSSNLRLGATFYQRNKSLNISLLYRFLSSRDGRAILSEKAHLYSNLIGLSGNVILFKNKKLHLITKIDICTEFATNYKDKYLLQKQYTPANIPDPNKYINTNSYNFYQGTPFIGDVLIGGDFNISKNLSINLMFGYGMRLLKSQEGVFHFTGNYPNVKVILFPVYSQYLVAFHMLNFQFGLSYVFSFKKKEKPTSKK